MFQSSIKNTSTDSLKSLKKKQTNHSFIRQSKGFIKVKYALCILLLAVSLPGYCQLELYGKFNKNKSVEPVINYAGNKQITKDLSIVYFGLLRKSWGQALIGLSYSPNDRLSFAGYIGMEHGQNSPRYSASVGWKKGKNKALILGELGSGDGNYLYKINIFRQISNSISIGVMDWRYHGLGPNFRYTISKLNSTIWIMPAYDHEQKVYRTMLGYSFPM